MRSGRVGLRAPPLFDSSVVGAAGFGGEAERRRQHDVHRQRFTQVQRKPRGRGHRYRQMEMSGADPLRPTALGLRRETSVKVVSSQQTGRRVHTGHGESRGEAKASASVSRVLRPLHGE